MQHNDWSWVVKVKKTQRRVGMLSVAVPYRRATMEFRHFPSLSVASLDPSKPVSLTSPLDSVIVYFDWGLAEAWVDDADALVGIPGYEPDWSGERLRPDREQTTD